MRFLLDDTLIFISYLGKTNSLAGFCTQYLKYVQTGRVIFLIRVKIQCQPCLSALMVSLSFPGGLFGDYFRSQMF